MIKTKDLWHQFDGVTAVKGLNLIVRAGTSFGLVGPNGAGKTTTLRILAGLLEPTSGEVEICNFSMSSDKREVYRRIGYMPAEFSFYDDLTVWEYLDYFGDCYNVKKRVRHERIKQLLGMTRLTEKKDAYINTLSRGMQQRLLIAKTLINNPEVLLLDEPTTGLDPRSRIELREILKELSASGRTMVIASNILYDVSSVCTSLGIMNKGALIEYGTLEALSDKYRRERTIQIYISSGIEKIEEVFSRDSKVVGFTIEGRIVNLKYEGDRDNMAELNSKMCEAGIKCIGLCEEKETIEDIFLRITS
ncbi:MAG: ABC transporter ATP-binding protein [Planctomycetota bacterium]